MFKSCNWKKEEKKKKKQLRKVLTCRGLDSSRPLKVGWDVSSTSLRFSPLCGGDSTDTWSDWGLDNTKAKPTPPTDRWAADVPTPSSRIWPSTNLLTSTLRPNVRLLPHLFPDIMRTRMRVMSFSCFPELPEKPSSVNTLLRCKTTRTKALFEERVYLPLHQSPLPHSLKTEIHQGSL